MGKLAGQRFYLAGAIDKCNDYGRNWRNEITPKLETYGITVYNPMKSPILGHNENSVNFIQEREKLRQEGKYDELAIIMKKIRHNDLRLTDRADACIFYIDNDIHTFGSIEEISSINRAKKPVLTVVKQGKNQTPFWLFGMVSHQYIFSSFIELFSYLTDVNEGKITDNRWIFYNENAEL